MAEARQAVKYTFLKVEAPVLGWPIEEREAAVREFTDVLETGPTAEALLAYSTVGLRGDCDLLIWQAADTVDAIQRAESQWRATRLGPYFRRSEEHTSELQSHLKIVCRLLLEKKKKKKKKRKKKKKKTKKKKEKK